MAPDGPDREARLDAAIGEFLTAEERGQAPDPEEWMGRHPDLAADLRAFLDDRAEVDRSFGFILPEAGTRYGDYCLLRVIGRGGMGVVFEAEYLPKPGSRLAVKVLPSYCFEDPADVERFIREARIVASLSHPNIVRVHDFDPHHRTPFIVMQRIDGADLRAVIRDLRYARDGRDPAPAAYVVSLPWAPEIRGTLGVTGEPPWRAIALIGLQAANALAFAHGRGVLHRDVKPSNLMLDRRGDVYLTDFGLAQSEAHPDLTETAEIGGSLRFMAPERFERKCDERSDLYSLGLTLYELLTLRPAFDVLDRPRLIHAILNEKPRFPRRIDPAIPRDLETIVLKAMSKEPDGRYASAEEMADDFRRYLEEKPIRAKRPTLPERGARWVRRHTAATMAAVAILGAAVLGLSVSTLVILKEQRKSEAARRDADIRAIQSRLERILGEDHRDGWSEQAFALAREAAELGENPETQMLAASSFAGFDAHSIRKFPFEAKAVAFDPEGKHLYMTGTDKGIQIWDMADDRIETIDKQTHGPIAFRSGTPVVLTPTSVAANPGAIPHYPLELWNVEEKKTVRFFDGPLPCGSIPKSWAISADGSRVGAVSESPGGAKSVIAWGAAAGHLLCKIPYAAEGLAIAPDASLLAAWDDAGNVDIWNLPGGEPALRLQTGTTPIHTVAFGPNHWRRGPHDPASAPRWLLAAGDRSGGVTIWDLATRQRRSTCLGSQYDITGLAFSPDGTTLASSGYSYKLWDVATGRNILDIRYGLHGASPRFSADGTKLVSNSRAVHGMAAAVHVHRLEAGRGIQVLRGLPSPVTKVIFSPDGRLVAALSHDWWAAIWGRTTGRLLRILDVPRGIYADNAALAFSPDGRRFAFAAGHEARMWDVETGDVLRAWPLPEGYTDALAFHGPDQLLLMRTETRDGKGRPYGNDPADHPSIRPRVARLRDLLGEDPTGPIRAIGDFDWKVHRIEAAPDGSCFVVEGLGGLEGKTRAVSAYDPAGERLWTLPSRQPLNAGATIQFDTTGGVLLLAREEREAELIAMPSGSPLRGFGIRVKCLGRDAESWVEETAHPGISSTVLALHHRAHEAASVRILTRVRGGIHARFSPDGDFMACGNEDGSVSVCDWETIRGQLETIGLGW